MNMKNKQQYFKWGLTIFLTGCALLVFYDMFYRDNAGTMQAFFEKLTSVLAPVIYGFCMAYLLMPVVGASEKLIKSGVHALQRRRKKPEKITGSWLRCVSILLTWALVLVLIYLLMSVLVPQLVESTTILISNLEGYYNKIYDWVNSLLDRTPQVDGWLEGMVDRYYNEALESLTSKILPSFQTLLTNLTGGIVTGVWGIITFAKNILIGLIISVYLLFAKEGSIARCCKLIYAVLKEEYANFVIRGFRKANSIFSGFVSGKLLDSLIIGILCLIGCTTLGIPYAPLVSVVVGVTNVIPFFGPFLGAIPSALLILLASPLKCLYFIIFVILLQQLDGNVIGPKILGGSTGISSFWVVVAILVGGGFGGVLGMLVGVPIFACVQSLVKWLINRRLTQRQMPLEAYEYVDRDREESEKAENNQ